jgi:signal transduction histidine kinase/ActR/RegA family two-component response regulator
VLVATSPPPQGTEPILTERIGIHTSASGTAVLTGEPLIVNDLDSNTQLNRPHRDALLRLGHRAFLAKPVAIGERVAGLLVVCRASPFSGEDLAIASAFASQAATALENARLYQEIQRAYAELSTTQDQLVQAQKMEAVGRLAGGVAHDFNNLMTVIMGRAMLMGAHLGAGHPLRRHVDIVKETSDRAATVTRQLLAFSRKQILQPKIVDLNALVSGMERMLRPLIGEDIDLVTVAGRGLSPVRVDASQFEQVLVNLAVNARDAMPAGGRLTIETANVAIDESEAHAHLGLEPGRYVMVAMSDTGCGMDAATARQSFEPFFTTEEPGKGTGLGLSMVYGTVKQSGGFIYVYSEPGIGTTFKIYLPPAEGSIETGVEPSVPASAPRGTETLLIVEDDENVRELLRDILADLGYTILMAENGAAALDICERNAAGIDLVLTDVVMPRLSGPDMVRRLSELRPGLKVLYVSGYTDHAIVHHGVLDRGTPFLEKPFTPVNIGRKVRQVLDQTELVRAHA